MRWFFLIFVNFCAGLSFAAEPSENSAPYAPEKTGEGSQVAPSPYDTEKKDNTVLKDYFKSHGTSLKETIALPWIEEASEEGLRLREGDIEDGVPAPHSPTPDDAVTPIDPHAAMAQKALEKELEERAIVENVVDPALKKELTHEPGEPDNKKELALVEEDKRGQDIVPPPITSEEIRRAELYMYP